MCIYIIICICNRRELGHCTPERGRLRVVVATRRVRGFAALSMGYGDAPWFQPGPDVLRMCRECVTNVSYRR